MESRIALHDSHPREKLIVWALVMGGPTFPEGFLRKPAPFPAVGTPGYSQLEDFVEPGVAEGLLYRSRTHHCSGCGFVLARNMRTSVRCKVQNPSSALSSSAVCPSQSLGLSFLQKHYDLKSPSRSMIYGSPERLSAVFPCLLPISKIKYKCKNVVGGITPQEIKELLAISSEIRNKYQCIPIKKLKTQNILLPFINSLSLICSHKTADST